MIKWILLTSAVVGLFYIFMTFFSFSIAPLSFPYYYEWMYGHYQEGAADYTSDFLNYLFIVFVPLSLLLGIGSATLLKKQFKKQYKKIFILLGVIGVLITAYLLIAPYM